MEHEIIFTSAKEMLDTIQNGTDLYNPNLQIYVFVYNIAGSIAYYNIDINEASELARQSEESDEYWGAFLGRGGYIIDDPSSEFYEPGDETNYQWWENVFKEKGWIDTNNFKELFPR